MSEAAAAGQQTKAAAGWKRPAARSPLNIALNARLGAGDPTDPAAAARVGALLAFTPSAVRAGGSMVFSFPNAATGEWAVHAVGDAHAKLINIGTRSARVFVFYAPNVLSRFGFRDGNWRFGSGASDSVAISLGAMHAGGSLNKQGLKIACPTSGLVLTLMAALGRVGVTATPTVEPAGVSVGRRRVPGFLNELGLDDIADQYVQLAGPKARGDRS